MGRTPHHDLSCVFREAELQHRFLIARDDTLDRFLRRRGDEIVRVMPRVFARSAYLAALSPKEHSLHLLHALGDKHPTWTFSHTSAALAYGLYLSYPRLREVHITGKRGTLSRERHPIRRHDAAPALQPARIMGLPVTPLQQTVLDCCRMLPFPEALAVADAATRFYRLSAHDMLSYAEEHGAGRRGIGNARRAIRHARPESENGGESIARGIMIEEGFLEPALQQEVIDPIDGSVRRVDYLWLLPDGTVIIGEHDGNVKYTVARGATDPLEQLSHLARAERLRESHLTIGHASVIRFTPELVRDRTAFVRLLEAYGVPRVGTGRMP